MVDYAYTVVTGKIKDLLAKVRTTGRPAKFTQAHLKTLGFTSSNDTSLIGVLKFIGFIDSNDRRRFGTSTGARSTSRSWPVRSGRDMLISSRCIRTPMLEATLSLLTCLVRVHLRRQVIAKTVATFKALVEEADFSAGSEPTETSLSSGPLHGAKSG